MAHQRHRPPVIVPLDDAAQIVSTLSITSHYAMRSAGVSFII